MDASSPEAQAKKIKKKHMAGATFFNSTSVRSNSEKNIARLESRFKKEYRSIARVGFGSTVDFF